MASRIVSIFEGGSYAQKIREAVDLLKQGKLVVLPTETVYGAAGLLMNPLALAALRTLRGDETGATAKPFIPHIHGSEQAGDFLGPVNELAQRMMRKLWPGPVTLIFSVPAARRSEVAVNFGVRESDLYDGESITLRCPDHPVALDVIGEAQSPVVAVRAGVQGGQPALKAPVIAEELDGQVALVIDAGPPRFAKASTIIRVTDTGYEIVRSGVYDERIIERLLRTTILFVCSGNTCRSPMAEAIARRVLANKLNVAENELERKGINVMSAGAMAMPGSRATPQAVEAVKSLGADLTQHRSRPLSVELIHEADVIYAMGESHAQAVKALVPAAAERVSTLAKGRDIDDPIGGDSALYHELAGELQALIESRLNETILRASATA